MKFYNLALNNVKRNFRRYLGYFISCVISTIVFFFFAIYLFHPNLSQPGTNLLFCVTVIAEFAIFIFSFIFAIYSLYVFVKARSKEFSIFMILGMSKKQFNRLIFLEISIIGWGSIIIGIILGVIFSNFFLVASEKIMINDSLYLYLPLKAIVFTIIAFLILSLLISLSIPVLIRRKKIIFLLRQLNEGDREIKFSKFMSVLSILLLCIGYLIAISNRVEFLSDFLNVIFHKKRNQILFLTITAIIGTYLFFSQFTIFAIEILKKKKSFYMKKVNMIWIADLGYSMRRNSITLFLVTILSTLTFTSISILYLINDGVNDNIINNYPMQFVYLSLPGNEGEQQDIKTIEECFYKAGFKFKKYTAIILRQQTDDKKEIYIVKLSDYNKLISGLNMKNIYLNKNESYIVEYSYKTADDIDKPLSDITWSLNNEKVILRSIGAADKNIFMRFLFSTIIVVNDNTFKTIENNGHKNNYYGFKIEEWEKTGDTVDYIYKKINKKYSRSFIAIGAGHIFKYEKEHWTVWFYVCFFIAIILFISAGSFLYCRFYTDLNQQKEKYKGVSKIGITLDEMKKVATIQIAMLFFIPYIFASIHTCFFLQMFELFQGLDLKLIGVLLSFFVVHFMYFLIIRSRYIKYLSRFII
ncbi:FtsX-like permease family protein [Tepidibacter hydrothermalis]|uniref:FtsX-like permease family protein n=1 Tax=Tepidibacter hydrothermalis TaxID=3036126 RepID=A0ABY8E6Y2_9FIRM|nr:FtsX-like permease family protein [Tepidibacter hydrothermalis]WFD08651.1 FtsX-like permease family protein [Tepidibacter hydrothermalis]